MAQHPDLDFTITVTGEPVTPDLQRVFGAFGKVNAILVRPDGSIDVEYEGVGVLRYFAAVMGERKRLA